MFSLLLPLWISYASLNPADAFAPQHNFISRRNTYDQNSRILTSNTKLFSTAPSYDDDWQKFASASIDSTAPVAEVPTAEVSVTEVSATDKEMDTKPRYSARPPPEKDNKILHLGYLILGTLWWYGFSTFEFLTNPHDFIGISEGPLYNALAAYVTISQIIVYGFLWKLMTSNSLREGQGWVLACIFACVPADTIVILFDPTGSKAVTVVAFTLVTLIYGVLLAFYLRRAADLEPCPVDGCEYPDSHLGIFREIRDYRPPAQLQNTHMATDFATAFGAFTVTVAAMRDQLNVGEVGPFYYIVLFVVVAHAAMEMCITTLTPGIDLEQYNTWLKFQAVMSLFQMFAATYIAHLAPEEGMTIWDDLIYSCLFGSAAASFSEFSSELNRDVDFDDKFGISSDNA